MCDDELPASVQREYPAQGKCELCPQRKQGVLVPERVQCSRTRERLKRVSRRHWVGPGWVPARDLGGVDANNYLAVRKDSLQFRRDWAVQVVELENTGDIELE